MEQTIIQIISQIGFPAAISIYCLLSLNKTIQEHTDAINKLKLVLTVVLERLDCGEAVDKITINGNGLDTSKKKVLI